MHKKYHYLYKVTRTDGKFYIGMHSTNDLGDQYMGSGNIIRASINKHGQAAHTKEIIKFFDTRDDLIEGERLLVTTNVLRDPQCMNLREGGQGGNMMVWDQSARKVHSIRMQEAYREPGALSNKRTAAKRLWESDVHKQRVKTSVLQTYATEDTKAKRQAFHQRQRLMLFSHEKRALIAARVAEINARPQIKRSKSIKASEKRWVSREGKCYQVHFTDVEGYLNQGYSLGRKG